MKRPILHRTAFVGAVALVSALVFLIPGTGVAQNPLDKLDANQREAVETLQVFSDGFAAVAQTIMPSVVTVISEGTSQAAAENNPFSQFMDDPRFQQFFGNPQPRPFKGLGSGVIVREDGIILTNHHVINGADEVTVVLSDETRLPAEVVGSDPRTDVAVLRVDADDLPAATFGDSDALRIGEWVVAVGSPFSERLSTSVTAGIVSAKGRSGMRLSEYEDFIQTDAAINPGNSGGALVDLHGRLVGINSAIASRAGGSNGIGFAIPANMARDVMNDLLTTGKVSRGYLGVNIQDLDEDTAEALGLDDTFGILVRDVQEGTPAYDAGMRQGDVILTVDGEKLHGVDDLRLKIARTDPGTVVDVMVLRDGKEKRLTVELAEYPDDEQLAQAGGAPARDEPLGLTVEPITPDLERRFELGDTRGSVVVTVVAPGSPAMEKGIQPGDIVLAVNREDVHSLREFREALDGTAEGAPTLFLLQRGENTFFVGVRGE